MSKDMERKSNVILTCCCAKYAGFLLDHWLPSLQENVDLRNIDVVILDYGLTDAQRGELDSRGVYYFASEKNGFVSNVRYRDIVRLVDAFGYRRILSCDGGDIIFQSDISELFQDDGDLFRAAAEEIRTPFFESIINLDDVRPELRRGMLEFLYGKPIFNCGAVLGSATAFRAFWNEYQKSVRSFDCYGVDQLIFNFYAYNHGIKPLDFKHNFVLVAAKTRFQIRHGKFYDQANRLIPVVHNAGGSDAYRLVDAFGYGPERNRRRSLMPAFVKIGVWMLNQVNATKQRFTTGGAKAAR